jgi:hypothetical protein
MWVPAARPSGKLLATLVVSAALVVLLIAALGGLLNEFPDVTRA